MRLPSIIYYGPPGLDADVFTAYLTNLGFAVRDVPPSENLTRLVDADPFSILVLALDETPERLIGLVRELRARTLDVMAPIFILAAGKPFDPQTDCVFVLPGPFMLANTIRRIQSLAGIAST